MAYEKELGVALNAVKKASNLCADVQFKLLDKDSLQKKDRSPVTIADYGSQAVISALLSKYFPADSLVGEEDVGELKQNKGMRAKVLDLVCEQLEGMDEQTMLSMIARGNEETDYAGRYWTCDPIDGTKGFLRQEQYSVALALIENNEIKLGVLGCPNLPRDFAEPSASKGCLIYAVKGIGAFMCDMDCSNKTQIYVDPLNDASRARFVESVESLHSAHSVHAEITKSLGITTEPLRIDSQGKYAAVGRGDVSIYLRYPTDDTYREKIWDHAAGAIVVQEAGGKVTDIYGEPLDFSLGRKLANNRGAVVTNGHIHDSVIAAIAQLGEK